MAAEPGMAEAFEVGHFTAMGVALQSSALIHHFLEALLNQRVIQMRQPRLGCVVLRPAARRWGDDWKRRLSEGLLRHGQLLLQINQLLLKPGNLLVAFPQLLQRIHQGVAIDSGQGFNVALRRRAGCSRRHLDPVHTAAPAGPILLCCRRPASADSTAVGTAAHRSSTPG